MFDQLSDPVRAIREREAALYRAMAELDYAALDALLADDLTYVHSTGVAENKSGYLAALQRGLYEYGDITRGEGMVQVFGTGAASRDIIDMRVGPAGQPKGVIRLLQVLIWVKADGAWRLSLRQATRNSHQP